jgi:rfaE bifunctional protein kinase chain/domain
MLSKDGIQQLFDDFNKLKIMIIGDVMIDSYIFGKVDRISPEAPVPIVAVEKRVNRLGGAANVALNVRSMGANPILCSVVGNDQKASDFLQLLEQNEMAVSGIFKSEDRITTTKYRIIGNKTQMLRVDEEQLNDLDEKDQDGLENLISSIILNNHIDAIIFQDYNKGVLTPKLIAFATQLAINNNIPVVVDPKKKNFLAYKNVTLFKPNLKELKEGLNVDGALKTIDQISDAMQLLNQKLDCKYIMVTLSEKGVLIKHFQEGNNPNKIHFPAHIRNIADVSGAGDTVISVATLCLALNQPIEVIAGISNLAGGIVCEEVGVIPIDKSRLIEESLKLSVM